MADISAQFMLLARANIYEWLMQVRDPKRELAAKITELAAQLSISRQNLAHRQAQLADYESADQQLVQNILEENELAKKWAGTNDDTAMEHLIEKKKLQKQLEKSQQETKQYREQYNELHIAVDAVAEQLSELEKVYGKILMEHDRGSQVAILNQIVATKTQSGEVMDAETHERYKQEALAEMHGVEIPHATDAKQDPALLDELEQFKKMKKKKER